MHCYPNLISINFPFYWIYWNRISFVSIVDLSFLLKYKIFLWTHLWICFQMSEWVKLLSNVWVFLTPWTVAYQAPLSMGFSRQEYWSGLSFPSSGEYTFRSSKIVYYISLFIMELLRKIMELNAVYQLFEV